MNVKNKDTSIYNFMNKYKDNKNVPHMSLKNLDEFLNTDIENNKKQKWNKLTKTEKNIKIKKYASSYAKEHRLTDEEKNKYICLLKMLLETKKLSKQNQIKYDENDGKILEINTVSFDEDTRDFILK